MACAKRSSFILCVALGLPFITLGEIRPLKTKQLLSNIRYLSSNGKHTYYQKQSGDLLYSSNYKTTKVIQGKPNTQYQLLAGYKNQYIIITQDENFFSEITVRKNKKIYSVPFGEFSSTYIGNGGNPRIHLDDLWTSYFDYYKRKVYFYLVLAFCP